MKKAIIFPLLFTVTISECATWFVSTQGIDSNPGTFDQPWASVQKGFSSIRPGDTLFIRGGTYLPSGTQGGGMFCGACASRRKGTQARHYNVFAYPGELPVIDCRKMTAFPGERAGILLEDCDYWTIRGIEITMVRQYPGPPARRSRGLLVQSGNSNTIENISVHNIEGPGIELRDASENNLFINCDSFDNYDPHSQVPGDDADGFDIGFIAVRQGNDRVNTLDGCRAWSNSDDGFDMYQSNGYHGIYILRECWAWKNGYLPDGVTRSGDGNGFKLGADNSYPPDPKTRRSLYNCIACANRQRGFSQESANVRMVFYNNLAFRNGSWGFSFFYYDLPDTLRNNISYKNEYGQIEHQGINRIHDHNSWDSGIELSLSDFVSTEQKELASHRQSDGSLPGIAFMHLRKGSRLIDAGAGPGILFQGTAPDMGPFETDPDGAGSFAEGKRYLQKTK